MIGVVVYVLAQIGTYFVLTTTPLFADVLPPSPHPAFLWMCIAHAVAFGLFLRGPVAAPAVIAAAPWVFGIFTHERALGALTTGAIATAGCFAVAVQARLETGDNRRRLAAVPVVVVLIGLAALSVKLIFGGPRTYHASSGMFLIFALPLGVAVGSAAYDSARHTALAFGLATLAFGAVTSAQIASVEANLLSVLAADPSSRASIVLSALQQRAPLITHRAVLLPLTVIVAAAGCVWAWRKTSRPNAPMAAAVAVIFALPVVLDLTAGSTGGGRPAASIRHTDVFEKIALEEIEAIDPSWLGLATTSSRSRTGN